ncbi:uncharacterized protein MYCFIDRAFT_80927 [Pseudocercospora fijiensis CIRAD86]|uniref:Uncharacterized protein n=1 Tax=Pseudocercospora fijiensis (strain CIRAD86) TaxID=383855 RepID=M3A290_PSEFD|nr:uncharacterized protein MYCFIDRAFT_80927 [Pseudocercospora fijiensis CIRAD86]EME78516.1 hypothetical protein MYCFIDRAFT_80927 [Pseudocercospora fijiensis CIRAD86]
MLRKALKESKQAVAGQRSPSPVDEDSPRRKSYYWHGHRYEVDENTRPEWIDAGRRKASRPSTPRTAPSDIMPAPIVAMMSSAPPGQMTLSTAPIIATPPPRPAPSVAQVVKSFAASGLAPPSQPSILLPSTRIPWKNFWSFEREARDSIYRHSMATDSVIQLNWEDGPPHISSAPVFASLGSPLIARECLEIFFAENTFQCPFHTALYKFLKQLPDFVLPHVQAVRLSHPISHAGYVRTLLEKLNERTVDGLRAGVVKVAMTVEGEGDLMFVGLEDLKDFIGIEGGSSGLKVARRKGVISRQTTNAMDQDAKGPTISLVKRQRKKSKKVQDAEDDEWTSGRNVKPMVSISDEDDDEPLLTAMRKRKKT